MICRNGLPSAGRRQRRETELLHRAKAILAQWCSLHCLSVRIGQMERIAESGVIDAEVRGAREIVEQADRLAADIDRFFTQPQNTEK